MFLYNADFSKNTDSIWRRFVWLWVCELQMKSDGVKKNPAHAADCSFDNLTLMIESIAALLFPTSWSHVFNNEKVSQHLSSVILLSWLYHSLLWTSRSAAEQRSSMLHRRLKALLLQLIYCTFYKRSVEDFLQHEPNRAFQRDDQALLCCFKSSNLDFWLRKVQLWLARKNNSKPKLHLDADI